MTTAFSPARWLEIHFAGVAEGRRPAPCVNSLHGIDFAPHIARHIQHNSKASIRNFDTDSRGAA